MHPNKSNKFRNIICQ